MAKKDVLEARESDCKSLDDYLALANEALTDPQDPEYARTILEKAEMQCQMPADYVKVAEGAYRAGDAAYADDLYEQAEDACFEAKEYALLGHSLASVKGDKEKGAELLRRAAEEASALPEFLMLSRYAQEDIGDEALAKAMLAKVEEKAKSLEDCRKIAETVMKDMGDAETARSFYKKAARYCGDIDATVAYAEGMITLFDDRDAARKVLDDAETDCQFTKDFVALASAYQKMFEDEAKVRELMEQAEEFTMTGEENAQLAEGLWKLLKDRGGAVAAYDHALAEMTITDELLALARTIARDLGDKEVAKKAYAKAEAKMDRGAELAKLAQAVVDDLEDKEYASEIYGRAAEKLTAANDLQTLAGEVLKNLGDRERAIALYAKAISATSDFNALGKILDDVKTLDDATARSVLVKMGEVADATPEYLTVAEGYLTILQDKAAAASMLDQAEEKVTSLDEMRRVTEAVDRAFADDAERVQRVKQKLEKRQANQARYAEFQSQEAELKNVFDYLGLAKRVMAELEDPFYTAKLLNTAEQMLGEQGYHFQRYRPLVLAIDQYLNDRKWVERLLDWCAERTTDFVWYRDLARTASRALKDHDWGAQLARRYYQEWQGRIGGNGDGSPYDYSKLAVAVHEDLGDATWASELLDKAEGRAQDHYDFAHLGYLRHTLGDAEKAQSLYRRAAESCAQGEQCQQLIERLRAYELSAQDLASLYKVCGERLATPSDRLVWAEGIVELFRDPDWAVDVYDALEPEFATGSDRARFEASRFAHATRPYYGAERRHS